MNFNSHTDLVITVAVGLVNLLTPGEDRSRGYRPPDGAERAAAITTLLRSTDSGRRAVTEPEAAGFAEVAAELRTVFAAVNAGDLDGAAGRVNALLERTGAHPLLDRHDGESWHLHFHSADGTRVNDWAAGFATGLAVVLGGEMYDRLGVCTAPRCDRVYVDTSRNGSRRFCSTACQNRVKSAAFRERRG
ncbi:MAG TPA: CGNR zinc finger domain-containing protein [Trebonia sp.]